jgi:hypothetical protein
MFKLLHKTSGTKDYAILTADSDKELEDAARKLRLPIHSKGAQEKHLDVSGHKIELARKKLGAADVMNPPDTEQ